ncbi:hypothetical protein OAF27_02465 [Verrucomicrobiales bacterium]|nr:hypothetical protein [Verrucomicrobiales bacterium]
MSTESLESTEAATVARPGWSLVGKKKEKEPSVTDRGKRLLAMMDPVASTTPEAALPPVPLAEVDPAAAMPAAAAPVLPPSPLPVAASQPTADVEIPAIPSDIPVSPAAEVSADGAPVGGPPPVPADVLAAMEATSPVAVTTAIPTAATALVPAAPPAERPVAQPIPIDPPVSNTLPPVPSEDTASVALEPGALPVDDSDGIEVIGEMDEVEPVSLGDIPPVPVEATAPTEQLPLPGLPDVELPIAEVSLGEDAKELGIPEVPGMPPAPLPNSFAPEAMPDPLASLPPLPGMPSSSPAPAPAPGAPVAGVAAPIELPSIDLPPVISEALAPAPAETSEESIEPEAEEKPAESEAAAPTAGSEFSLPPLPEAVSIPEAPKAEIEVPELPELPVAETASPDIELPAAVTDAVDAVVPESVELGSPVKSPFGIIDTPASPEAEEVPLAEVSEPALSIPPIAKTTAIPIPVQSPFSVASPEPEVEAEAPKAVVPAEDADVTPDLPEVQMPAGLGALPSAPLAGAIASPFAPAESPALRPAPPEEAPVSEVSESAPVIASPFQIAEPQTDPVQAELPTETVAEIEAPVEEEPLAQIEEEPAPVAASPFQLVTPELPEIPSPVVTDGPTTLAPLAEEEAPLSPLAEAQKKIEALAEKTSAPDYVERPAVPEIEAETSPEMLVRTPGAFLEEVVEEDVVDEEESSVEIVAEAPESIEPEIVVPQELPTADLEAEPASAEIAEPASQEDPVEEPVAEIAPLETPAFGLPEVEAEAEAEILEEPEPEPEPEPETEATVAEVIEEIQPTVEIEEPTEEVADEVVEEVAASEETEESDIVRLLSPEEVAAKEEAKVGAAAATAAAAVAAGVPEVLIGTAFDGSYDDEVVNLISGETLSRTLRLPVADAVAGNFEVRLGFPDCSSYIFATVEIGGGHGRLRTGMVVNGCRAESVHGEAVLGSNLHELNLAFFLDGARLQMRAAVVRPSRMGDQLVLRGLGSFIHPELHGQLSLMPIPDIREEQTEI